MTSEPTRMVHLTASRVLINDQVRRRPKFEGSVDAISDLLAVPASQRFYPPLTVSVSFDGPTKVVTFKGSDKKEVRRSTVALGQSLTVGSTAALQAAWKSLNFKESVDSDTITTVISMDVEVFVKSLRISMVDTTPLELLYVNVNVSGISFRFHRFSSSQLAICEVADIQIDNQLPSPLGPFCCGPLLCRTDLGRTALVQINHGHAPESLFFKSQLMRVIHAIRPVSLVLVVYFCAIASGNCRR